jgi:uncharacterized protein YjbI with pentapeptide repeats
MTNDQFENNKVKPEDNFWYLLATLYGQPEPDDYELQTRNRTAWNRYMAVEFAEESRAQLIKEKPHLAEDLKPFSAEELDEVKKTFSERDQQASRTTRTTLPDLKLDLIDFSNVDFDSPFWAENFFFPAQTELGRASFQGATFSQGARFQGATFSQGADFQGATFSQGAGFQRATFSQEAGFQGATFSQEVSFQAATFSQGADFQRATFSQWAGFQRATFSQGAFFVGATFSRWAGFQGATFSQWAFFQRATFRFESSFVNAEMEGPTSFEAAMFSSKPPQFFGAKLHEGTDWHNVTWPALPRNKTEAKEFVAAYERLKLEMDRLKKHEDELNFFALELQSRRVLYGKWRGLPIKFYGLLCDYGRSYFRPLYGLLITTAIGVLPFWWHFVLWNFGQVVVLSNFWQAVVLSNFWQAVGLSLVNTFGVLGFRKDFIAPEVLESLPGTLKVVAALQTTAGIVLLFLFGLAIRNRFRMK